MMKMYYKIIPLLLGMSLVYGKKKVDRNPKEEIEEENYVEESNSENRIAKKIAFGTTAIAGGVGIALLIKRKGFWKTEKKSDKTKKDNKKQENKGDVSSLSTNEDEGDKESSQEDGTIQQKKAADNEQKEDISSDSESNHESGENEEDEGDKSATDDDDE